MVVKASLSVRELLQHVVEHLQALNLSMKTSSGYQSSGCFNFSCHNYHNFMVSSKSGKQFPLLFDAAMR